MTNGVAWMPVSLQQSPPPAAEKPVNLAPIFVPIFAATFLLLGYSVAMGYRDWQLLQAQQQAAKAQAQQQALEQAKSAYCQGVK